MGVDIPQHYKEAAQQISSGMLKSSFASLAANPPQLDDLPVNAQNGFTQEELKQQRAQQQHQAAQDIQGQKSGANIENNSAPGTVERQRRLDKLKDAERQKQQAHTRLMALLADFNSFEGGLAGKYGDDFAAQWAVDLLDEETAQHIASLSVEQQRLALWKEMEAAFTEGSLDRSRLTPEQLRFYDDGAVKYQNADYESEQVLKNEKRADEISQLGKEVGADKTLEGAPDIKSDFEIAAVDFDQSTSSELDLASLDTSFDIDGMDLG